MPLLRLWTLWAILDLLSRMRDSAPPDLLAAGTERDWHQSGRLRTLRSWTTALASKPTLPRFSEMSSGALRVAAMIAFPSRLWGGATNPVMASQSDR